MFRLDNKKILIIGSTGVVGKATAIKLSELGAKLVISGRNQKKLDEILNLLQDDNHRSIAFDVRNISEASKFIKDVVGLDGIKLDGLVYSAGIIPVMPIKNTTYEFLSDIMLVNFFAFVELVRHFSDKRFSNPNSSIVVLSSYAAINGDKGQLAYASSKGAIDSSVVVMAKELYIKNKIRINALRPAVVDSGKYELSDRVKELVDIMQTGMIEPENLAEHIAFLLSTASSGVYGRCFDVKGYL